jgi:TolB protein
MPTPTRQPALSGRIAFTVYEGGGYETYVANIDGSGRQMIWSRMHQPDFDPSGTQLVANGELPNHLDLQLIPINPDNTFGQPRKVSVNYEDSWPSWSPDGFRVVFVFYAANSQVRTLSDLNTPTEWETLKGPDGKNVRDGRYTVWVGDRIALTTCDHWETGSACGIYSISAGGGDATRISDDSKDRATDGFGNQLVYMSPADGDWEIYKVASTGGSPLKLTDNNAKDGLATWSPDGQHIAFLTNRTGSWEIWVMNADGSDQRRLFTLPGDVGEWTEERISWGS